MNKTKKEENEQKVKEPETKVVGEKKVEKKVEKKEEKKPAHKKTFYTAVGRRKTSIARAKLLYDKGPITVNGKNIEEYFSGEISKVMYIEPFRTTNTIGRWSGTITVTGGGPNSQLQAVILAVSRLLVNFDERLKPILRKRGFMTRDPREKERKKPGLMGARKKKQSPKR